MNQKLNSILSGVLFILYITLIGVLMFFMWQLPASYGKVEQIAITDAEAMLYESFSVPENEMKDKLLHLSKEFPMELLVKKGEEVIFQTLPETDFHELRNSLNPSIVLYEQELEIDVADSQTYDIWFSMYHITASSFINSFLFNQSMLVLILIALIVAITVYMQFTLFAPMKKIKDSLEKAENYNFEEILDDSTGDVINQKFSKFTRNITTTMKNVSRQHTELERDLQIERERLNNTIVVSRALIHDLKTPVHEVMLENEYRKENEELTVQAFNRLLDYNMEHSAQILDDINEVLEIVDFDMYTAYLKTEAFDLSKMMLEMRKTFMNKLRDRDLSIDLIIDEEMWVKIDRISMKLLVHNMMSNAAQYAMIDSEIVVEASIIDNLLIIEARNEASSENIARMEQSGNLFNTLDAGEEHRFSSGNGLFLINELSEILQGESMMIAEENEVIIKVVLPINLG